MILLDYLFAMLQMHKDSVQGLGMKLLWGQFSLGTASIFVWKDFRCPEKKYVCLDAGVMHFLFLSFEAYMLATPKPEPGRAGQNSYHTATDTHWHWAFQRLSMVEKKALFIFVSYFIVEWGPCSRIKLGTLGGDTRRWYHLAWSHNVTCYNSLHVIQAQIDLRFCVAGQQNGAREAVWSLCFVTLEECEMGREVRRMKIYQVSQKTKAVRLQTLHFAIVTPVERHALRTSFTFPC